ncbi:helix-turn-helix domain-containing protein [Arthrobacter sp. C9C5]|uniref:AraC-like ligand-binding domain-containing protein n=1 Tax=Arthrobacter sp. C9C5 TaxID=2735267 RepID=UPI00158596E2|nr:helix-turn-helix domain-containing protein [Arthrobacter sp. C9C5]NUU33316.1 helix-turn-helix domain-containing protein [Arthrobacter sp. C9C5]
MVHATTSEHAALALPAAASGATEATWSETVERSLLSFDFDFDKHRTFHGFVQSKPFAAIEFIDMSCGRHAAYRDESKISVDERPDYLMTLQLSGEFRLTQDGRTAVLRPGEFAFYDSTKPATAISSDDYRSLCVKFPQRLLRPMTDTLAERTATRMDADAGLSPSVWALLSTLNATVDSVANVNRQSTVRGIMGLVGSMLSSQSAGAPPRRQIETRDSLLEQIRSYIDDNLGKPELDPHEIAGAHFISVRHLHSLFHDDGFSVSAWIRDRRVERCSNDLADPLLASVPVASIANRWGFKGASHFGQIFKSATGFTPADFRQMALKEAR